MGFVNCVFNVVLKLRVMLELGHLSSDSLAISCECKLMWIVSIFEGVLFAKYPYKDLESFVNGIDMG